MYRDEISIGTFCLDVLAASEYQVDVNALLGVCGASPVHVHYKTDKIRENIRLDFPALRCKWKRNADNTG